MVTITKSSLGRCIWCCTEKDGVHAQFADGLAGHLCWTDFRKAVKTRSEHEFEKSAQRPRSGPTDQKTAASSPRADL